MLHEYTAISAFLLLMRYSMSKYTLSSNSWTRIGVYSHCIVITLAWFKLSIVSSLSLILKILLKLIFRQAHETANFGN